MLQVFVVVVFLFLVHISFLSQIQKECFWYYTFTVADESGSTKF